VLSPCERGPQRRSTRPGLCERNSKLLVRGRISRRRDRRFERARSTADLREVLDIDSMDFLNFITAVHHRTGIDIPEIDYPKLVTLKGMFAYLDAKLKVAKK
jgi:acyl carrier protein